MFLLACSVQWQRGGDSPLMWWLFIKACVITPANDTTLHWLTVYNMLASLNQSFRDYNWLGIKVFISSDIQHFLCLKYIILIDEHLLAGSLNKVIVEMFLPLHLCYTAIIFQVQFSAYSHLWLFCPHTILYITHRLSFCMHVWEWHRHFSRNLILLS